jgi:hypothetical protein
MELTKQQIERQDFVDNAIANLVNMLVPDAYRKRPLGNVRGGLGITEPELEWNMEWIGGIREEILKAIAEWSDHEITRGYVVQNADAYAKFEQAFYPFIQEEVS